MAKSLFSKQPKSEVEVASHVKVLDQESFRRMLHVEQKRTERSRRRFVLMQLHAEDLFSNHQRKNALNHILDALSSSTRETDITGWYTAGSTIGVIFTEIGSAEGKVIAGALLTKVSTALASALSIEEINQVSLSFHVFPDEWDENGASQIAKSALYPGSHHRGGPRRVASVLKRVIDVVGSLALIFLFSPVLLAMAIAVKLTSPGPVLFRQKRVGQFGGHFTFLKFRSMQCNNDPKVHEEFVASFIKGEANGQSERASGNPTIFKIVKDSRLTPIGGFIRRTSLDELPQFFNVLAGQMSLVGPRPPIPYEVDRYDVWHKRRLLAVKPGITGLWQVTGRSRVTFDEMVRLDLKYAKSWSLWLDIKILAMTPRAVVFGAGAF